MTKPAPSQIEWDHVLLSNNRREESMFWERENEKGHGEEEEDGFGGRCEDAPCCGCCG